MRCTLAQAQRAGQRPLPPPILCPADGVEPVDGVLPDLGFVGLLRREAVLPAVRGAQLVPEGFAGRNAGPGVCRIVLGISARGHVDAATLRRALERMDAAWPEGEEHMAKRERDDMWARSTEVVYSVRSSSSELDGVARTSLRPLPTRGARCGTSSTRGGC